VYYVLTIAGVLLVAWAFTPRNHHGRRHRLLGWGAATAGVGGAAALLYDVIRLWHDAGAPFPFGWQAVFSVGSDLFWMLAFGTAARAFLVAARNSEAARDSFLAGRESLLTRACWWLSLSYACSLGGAIVMFFPPIDEDMFFLFDYTMAPRALGPAIAVLGAVLAAVAFSRSRRLLAGESFAVDSPYPKGR
jgi:hypothetical protein